MSEDNINVTVEGSDGEFSEETKAYIAEKAAETERLAAETARARQEAARANAESAAYFRANVETNLSSWQQEMQQAREARIQALEYGDFSKVDEAEQRLEKAKSAIAQWHQYAQTSAPRVQPADPVENYASRLPARSAQWVREHPELVRDERAQAKLQAAHYDAMANGLQAESPEYFSHVQRFASGNGDDVQSPRARATTQSEPKRGKVTVKLTAEDAQRYRETAESMGISFQEYVRRKVLMDADPAWRRTDDLGRVV